METWRKRRNFLADLARSREDIYVTIFYPLNSQLYFLTYVQLFLKTYTTAKLREGQKRKNIMGCARTACLRFIDESSVRYKIHT